MIYKNPYETTYGKALPVKKIIDTLDKYLSLTNVDHLSYEYANDGDVKLVYITGCNTTERDLPIFEQPIIFKTTKDDEVIVTDLRRYLKNIPKEETPLNISSKETIKDINGYEFAILNSLLTRDVVNDNLGIHRLVFKNSATALAIWVSNAVNSIIALDPVEKVKVEVATQMYFNALTTDDVNAIDSVIMRATKSKYTLKLSNKMAMDIINDLKPHLDKSNISLEGMIELIKHAVSDSKQPVITLDAFINVISNSWYGPGNSETLIISTEYLPTFMTLLYNNLDNKSYKRTTLASLWLKYSRLIEPTVVIKHFSNYLKDNIMK